MSLPPQKMREVVFQLLYSIEEGECEPLAAITLLSEELHLSASLLPRIVARVETIRNLRVSIDEVIEKHTPSYAIERIHSVERNILRLGTFELLHDPFIPPKVAIAEAIRLTRKFSVDVSASFVNAVLDAIYHSSDTDQTLTPDPTHEECAS